jgi:hypothetical protein
LFDQKDEGRRLSTGRCVPRYLAVGDEVEWSYQELMKIGGETAPLRSRVARGTKGKRHNGLDIFRAASMMKVCAGR